MSQLKVEIQDAQVVLHERQATETKNRSKE